jgi:hypothetical protein
LFILVIYSETVVLTPLETLNTNLNYKILDNFIVRMTDTALKLSSNNIIPTNRFSIESVDNNNSAYGNDKKPRITFAKLTQYTINTINELPERSLDDER